ncbi:thyroxine 5'-deiodinase [Balamuthia mandrillaris]
MNGRWLQDRIAVAQRFQQLTNYCLELYVDDMNNNFMMTFWAHPERYFIFVDGKLALKAEPTEEGEYPLEVISDFLNGLDKS